MDGGLGWSMRNMIISLARAGERRRAIRRQFASMNMEFEWVDGCDWRELTDEQMAVVDEEALAREGRRPLQLGEVGCMLSHREAMRRLSESEGRMAAIFEDDVELTDNADRVLAEIEAADIEFDLIFLHLRAPEDRFVPVRRLSGSHSLGIVKHKDQGTLAYVITREAARRYLDGHPRIVHHADHALQAYWESGLVSYTLNPPIVTFEYDPETSMRMESPIPRRVDGARQALRRIRRQFREFRIRRGAFRRRLNERR